MNPTPFCDRLILDMLSTTVCTIHTQETRRASGSPEMVMWSRDRTVWWNPTAQCALYTTPLTTAMDSMLLSTKLARLFTLYLLFTMAMGATVTEVMVPMVVTVAIKNS